MKKINNIRRCRLCACEESVNNFLNIFDGNPELKLEVKITKLLPIVVMPWDPMPHIICQECISKVNSFSEFYDVAVETEKYLRTLFPSVSEPEDVEPVVHAMNTATPNGNNVRLPPKKRANAEKPVENTIPGTSTNGQASEPLVERGLDSFIINRITPKDLVYTCRECYRTFTKQSTALTHSCDSTKGCALLGEKSLAPLKIRLFSMEAGQYVCHMCQSPFQTKQELIGHLKGHFENESGRKCKQKGKRRGRPKKQDEDEDWERVYKNSGNTKRRKKCSLKKLETKTVEVAEITEVVEMAEVPCPQGTCEKCGKVQDSLNTPVRETMERMTQCSEEVNSIEVKDEDVQILPYPEEDSVEMLSINKLEWVDETVEANVLENKTEISETARSPSEPYGSLSSREYLEVPTEQDNVVPIKDASPGITHPDEVTVLEVIDYKTATNFSSCVFCDKTFATKDALIAHQNKHLQHAGGLRPAARGADTFLCSVCGMTFMNRRILLDHERFHLVQDGTVEKIHIALTPTSPEQMVEQECQILNARGVLTITVTSREKKIPQIQL